MTRGSVGTSRLRSVARNLGAGRLRWRTKATLVGRYSARARDHLGYVLFDPETDNLTYDIDNVGELAGWVESIFGPHSGAYVAEIELDLELERELERARRLRPGYKTHQGYGRRMGWYAAVRATRPRLVVETGTHDGLGASVLLAALARNEAEGHPGRLVSVDPAEGCGWLVPGRLRRHWTQVRATSYDVLDSLLEAEPVDVFVHDSLHTAECEGWELGLAFAHAGPHAVVISDNSHALPTLESLASRHGWPYFFFHEQPRAHWYPGAGIGLAKKP